MDTKANRSIESKCSKIDERIEVVSNAVFNLNGTETVCADEQPEVEFDSVGASAMGAGTKNDDAFDIPIGWAANQITVESSLTTSPRDFTDEVRLICNNSQTSGDLEERDSIIWKYSFPTKRESDSIVSGVPTSAS